MAGLLRLIVLCLLMGQLLPFSAFAERAMTIRLVGATREAAPKRLTVAQLEKMPLVESEIFDPYLKKQVRYQGVCLTEFIKKFATSDTKNVRISAIDEYVIFFANDVAETDDFMLATRMDGELMSRAMSGPVKIVMKENDPDNHYVEKWIWMINRIEFLTN